MSLGAKFGNILLGLTQDKTQNIRPKPSEQVFLKRKKVQKRRTLLMTKSMIYEKS